MKRQAYLCEFETCLDYLVSFRTARATEKNLVYKNKNKKQTNEVVLGPVMQ